MRISTLVLEGQKDITSELLLELRITDFRRWARQFGKANRRRSKILGDQIQNSFISMLHDAILVYAMVHAADETLFSPQITKPLTDSALL